MTKIFSLPILILGLFTTFVLGSSSGVLWQTISGGILSDVGTDVIIVDNSIYISGYTRSFGNTGVNSVVGKFDFEGNLLWINSYGVAGDDIILSITYNQGYLWTAGWAIVNSKKIMSIIQVSLDGKFIKRILLGEGVAEKIIQTNDGFVLSGWYSENIYTVGIKIVKIDKQGNILWTVTDNTSGYVKAYDICETSFGFLACGCIESELQISMPYVLHINHEGILIDQTLLTSNNTWQTEIYSVERVDDGFVFGIGAWKDSQINAIILRTDEDLNEIWATEINDLIYGYSTKELPDGSILVGSSDRTLRYGDAAIIQLDQTGLEIDRHILGGDWLDVIHNITVLPDGRCAFTGATYSWNSTTDPDIYTGMVQFNVELPEEEPPVVPNPPPAPVIPNDPEIPKSQKPLKNTNSSSKNGCFLQTLLID